LGKAARFTVGRGGMNRPLWRWLDLLVVFVLPLSCSKHELAPDRRDGSVDRVIVAGSTAMLPLLTDAANDFMRSHPRIAVEVQGGGSHEGVTRTLQGEVTVGASDVSADASTASRLEDHKVAMSGFAAMANRGIFNEQIQSLSLEQLKNIFTGQLTDWFDVGGSHQHITVINRRKGSGTRVTFGQAVLCSDDFVAGPEQDSSALVLTSLEQTEGVNLLTESSVLTLSAHQCQIRTGDHAAPGQPAASGAIVDLIPTLSANGYTIKLKATVSAPETLNGEVNMYDHQTLLLSTTEKTKPDSQLIVLLTATLVDPVGNRVHTDDELPFAQNGAPPQN